MQEGWVILARYFPKFDPSRARDVDSLLAGWGKKVLAMHLTNELVRSVSIVKLPSHRETKVADKLGGNVVITHSAGQTQPNRNSRGDAASMEDPLDYLTLDARRVADTVASLMDYAFGP